MRSGSVRDAIAKAAEPAFNAAAELDMDEVSEQVGNGARRARGYMRDAMGQARHQAGELAGRANDVAHRAGRRMSSAYDDAREWTASSSREAYRYGRQHPLVSLGVLVGVGLVVGGLLMAASRRNRY